MATGKRIKLLRTRKDLTQKEFGERLGFKKKSEDVRVAQYESETRVPKEELTAQMAEILEVNPAAIKVPDIDTLTGIMHTFFALEDEYGLHITERNGEPALIFDHDNPRYWNITDMLEAWLRQSKRLESGEIDKEAYDDYRYNFPDSEAARTKELLKEARKKNKS